MQRARLLDHKGDVGYLKPWDLACCPTDNRQQGSGLCGFCKIVTKRIFKKSNSNNNDIKNSINITYNISHIKIKKINSSSITKKNNKKTSRKKNIINNNNNVGKIISNTKKSRPSSSTPPPHHH